MKPLATALLLLVTLAGCDSDSADPLARSEEGNVSTDPAALESEHGWRVIAVVSKGRTIRFPDAGFTVSFADGRVDGRADPNNFGGDYTATADGAFEARDILTTLVGSSPENERRATALLAEMVQAQRFEVSGYDLILRSGDSDGVRLTYLGFRAY